MSYYYTLLPQVNEDLYGVSSLTSYPSDPWLGRARGRQPYMGTSRLLTPPKSARKGDPACSKPCAFGAAYKEPGISFQGSSIRFLWKEIKAQFKGGYLRYPPKSTLGKLNV